MSLEELREMGLGDTTAMQIEITYDPERKVRFAHPEEFNDDPDALRMLPLLADEPQVVTFNDFHYVLGSTRSDVIKDDTGTLQVKRTVVYSPRNFRY